MPHAYLALRLSCRDGASSLPLPIRQRFGDVLLEYSERVWWASASLCCLEVVVPRASGGCGFPFDVLAERLSTLFAVDVTGGLASTADLALLAATLAPARQYLHVPAGNEQAFLSALSLRRLPDMDEDTISLLDELGLRRVGSLAGLEERGLIRLLGAAQGRLLHLRSEGRGLYPQLSPTERHSLTVKEGLDLDVESLLETLQRAGLRLAHSLREADLLAGTLKLGLMGADETEWRLNRALKQRTAQAGEIVRQAEAMLAGGKPHQTCWHELSLTAGDLEPVTLGQGQLWSGAARTAQIKATAGRLSVRYGAPALFKQARGAPSPLRERTAELVAVGVPTEEHRPLSVKPLDVQVEGGLPLAICWKGCWQGVRTVFRRWRVCWGWWNEVQHREYFLIETAAGGLREIFCDLMTMRWFVSRVYAAGDDGLRTSAHTLQL